MNKELPLVSMIMLGYNHEKFIKEAVEALFSQTLNSIEIILSDDCSTDATFEILQKMVNDYSGEHKIILNRNDKNLGIGEHINKLFSMASGELVVICAGDDISFPNRAEKLYEVFKKKKGIYGLHSDYYTIDENNKILDFGKRDSNFNKNCSENKSILLEYVWNYKNCMVTGASAAWKKELFDIFGPVDKYVVHEDKVYSFRSYLLGSIYYLDEPLIKRRVHAKSYSVSSLSKKIKSLEDLHRRENFEKDLICENLKTIRQMEKDLNCALVKKLIEIKKHDQISYSIKHAINLHNYQINWYDYSLIEKLNILINLKKARNNWFIYRIFGVNFYTYFTYFIKITCINLITSKYLQSIKNIFPVR